MNVSATPIPVARANSRSAGAAPTRATPLPASTTGLIAPRITSAAFSSSCALGSGRRSVVRAGSGAASTDAAMTSSGSSMWVGPGFCACAILNALRTASGMIRGLVRRAFHFVIGLNIETTSMYWCDSLCIRSRSPWPVMATTGERSRNASAIAVTRFVAPGPSVPRQTPARRVSRPYMSAMYAPPCSWRTGTNVTLERSSDSLRSSVSSPGMPNTYLTPSASRHSTNRSDALRVLIPQLLSHPRVGLTYGPRAATGPMPRTLRLILLTLATCALAAAPANAASRFTIRGAGFGHGVGMSQYGAYGFALHGYGYADILGHYYTGTALGVADAARPVRVLLRSGATSATFSGATQAGVRPLSAAETYVATPRAGGQVALRTASGRRVGTFTSPLQVAGEAVRLAGMGTYPGALELRSGAFGLSTVNVVGLEDYVKGVVARESPASWPLEALKAQAVTARTYAITTSKGGDGFDQYADTRSQVYGGVGAETPESNQA